MLMIMLAIPTPAMAASDPRCPANDILITCTKKLESIDTIAGTPIIKTAFTYEEVV